MCAVTPAKPHNVKACVGPRGASAVTVDGCLPRQIMSYFQPRSHRAPSAALPAVGRQVGRRRPAPPRSPVPLPQRARSHVLFSLFPATRQFLKVDSFRRL